METILLFIILFAIVMLFLRILVFLWPVVLGIAIGLFIYFHFFNKSPNRDGYHDFTSYNNAPFSDEDVIDAEIIKEEVIEDDQNNNY